MSQLDPATDRVMRRIASTLAQAAPAGPSAPSAPARSFADRVLLRIDNIEQAKSLRALNARADLRARAWIASAIALATLAGSLCIPQLSPPKIRPVAAASSPLSPAAADQALDALVGDCLQVGAAAMTPFPASFSLASPPARN